MDATEDAMCWHTVNEVVLKAKTVTESFDDDNVNEGITPHY